MAKLSSMARGYVGMHSLDRYLHCRLNGTAALPGSTVNPGRPARFGRGLLEGA